MTSSSFPKSILLTGGTGFIGSHTALSLLKKGYFIYIIDSLINSKEGTIKRILELVRKECPQFLGNIVFKHGDLRDIKFLKDIFLNSVKEKRKIDGVIHFAGLKSVSESIKEPIKYWDSNLVGSIHLLEVMHAFNCKTIIFSSSATIYGINNVSPISENAKVSPINPYGTTKHAVEQLLNDIFNSSSHSWKIANLRYFNPIGAHPSGLLGEDPLGIPNNIFPIILKVASKEIKEVNIFGSDWDTKDGTGVRDYIHVMDLAEGHVRTLDYLMNNNSQFINLNMGRGEGTSVLELIHTFEAVNKVDIPYVFAPKRIGDSGVAFADNSLMKIKLKWQPSRNLEEMCKDGWSWKLNVDKFR